MRAWVARLFSDALRKASEHGGTPADGAADPGPRAGDPQALDARGAVEGALAALRHALAMAVHVPMKLAGPLRTPLAAVCTVLKARPCKHQGREIRIRARLPKMSPHCVSVKMARPLRMLLAWFHTALKTCLQQQAAHAARARAQGAARCMRGWRAPC